MLLVIDLVDYKLLTLAKMYLTEKTSDIGIYIKAVRRLVTRGL